MRTLDEIVKSEALRGCPQSDWDRQRKTARHFAQRFADGYRTQLLADEVGMGKTYVALSVMAHHIFQNNRNDRKALLITPPSRILQTKWEQEIRSFDDDYILRKSKKSKRLRPILLKSYWDLIENLHDYENQTIKRFPGWLYRSFLQALFLWGIKNKKTNRRRTRWTLLENFDECHPDYLEFCSRFSQHALYSFFDRRLHEMLKMIKKLNNGECCDNEYKSLIRSFAEKQDSNEANVYVLGMHSLRRPKMNARQFKRLLTYYTGFLMKGRHKSSRKIVIDYLEKNGLLRKRQTYERKAAYYKWVADLSIRDIFGLRDAVEQSIFDKQIQLEWDQIYSDIISKKANVSKIREFYKKLSSMILKEKLKTAKIGLCVIDEVHNWKNGSNGAGEFSNNYAENISNKLIMSATPFQIHEEELQNIFKWVDGVKNLSTEALERIYQGGSLLQKCIDRSKNFQDAWASLKEDDVQLLHESIGNNGTINNLQSILNALQKYPALSETMSRFISKTLEYRKSIEGLKAELALFIVRHIKGREKRDYHIGRHYRPRSLEASQPCRTALYSTTGYADTADSFVNFLAIRLDQKIRQDTQSGYETNAHLLGGITSSTAAFKASNEKLCKSGKVSDSTKNYQQLFMSVLKSQPHPKVRATVERAFRNYCEGRKTLIFCERLATLDEIQAALKDKIHKYIQMQSSDSMINRETVLKNTAFVDNYWWRSILQTLDSSKKEKLEEATRHALIDIKKRLEQEMVDMHRAYSPRQLLQKVDILLFEKLYKKSLFPNVYSTALQLFAELEPEFLHVAGTRDIEDAEPDAELSIRLDHVIDNYLTETNLWFGPDEETVKLHKHLWEILESEAKELLKTYIGANEKVQRGESFGRMIVDIMKGLRKIALRDDLIALYLSSNEISDNYMAIQHAFYSKYIGSHTVLSRLLIFLENLSYANGSIIMAERTKRRSLWQGMFRKDISVIDVLRGDRDQDARIKLCAAFNSPLQPDILICTAIGSEGIDLHSQCAEIIHHDLPWNPAKLEQRIGRLDRVGSLAEVVGDRFIQIGIPFLEHNYEKFQYDLLWARAQRFEILMGQPDFDADIQDEEKIDEIKDGGSRKESNRNELYSENINYKNVLHLPQEMLDYLRIDLSL